MQQDIESPPYPGEGYSAGSLFNAMRTFRAWIVNHREDLNQRIGQEAIPDLQRMPESSAYVSLAVGIQFTHLQFMRQIREQWDHLVRTYEDAWDCKECVRCRTVLVQSSAVTFNSAFVPYEQREARQQTAQAAMYKMFENVTATLLRIPLPKPDGEDDESSEFPNGEED